jgi:hypothetical protein
MKKQNAVTTHDSTETVWRQIEDQESRQQEFEERDHDAENDLLFTERTGWRKRHMYKGWMLEPVIEQPHERAVITRSNYGYRVLNTPDLGMVDVDFDLEGNGLHRQYLGPQQEEALSNLRDWVHGHPSQSWRAYRTAAGLRLIRTDAPQSLDETYEAVCLAIDGTDRLYSELCHEQRAFRARVSPKPLRCGLIYPSWSPFDCYGDGWSHSDPDGTKVPVAIRAYEILAEQYRVCELVEAVGSGCVHPDLAPILALHDSYSRTFSNLPLETLADSETRLPATSDLMEFNAEFRPNGMAPDKVWVVLDHEVRMALRNLDNPGTRQRAIEDLERLNRLGKKWALPTKNGPNGPQTQVIAAKMENQPDGADDFFSKLAQ